MDDHIKSESVFFWRLSIHPTVFTVPFCESARRSFHFELKSGKALHPWQCDIIEDMINGAATIAINIHRANLETSPPSPPPPGSAVAMDLSQGRNSAVLDQTLHSARQETQEYSPGTCNDVVEYGNLSIHVPKYLNPLISTTLHSHSTISIRVDASEVLHNGKYEIVLVLSEETMSQITSPSSCHWVMDSIYHDIQPTVQPDLDSADVWFEFPEETILPEQQHLHRSDRAGSVVTLGAHWCVLSKYESLVRWIDHERQVGVEQQRQEAERVRRELHEVDMSFLHENRMQQQQQQEMQRLHEMHRRQYPLQQAQMRVVGPSPIPHHLPPSPMCAMNAVPMSMPTPPLPMEGQYYRDPRPHSFQQAHVIPLQPLSYPPPQHPQSYYHLPFLGVQDPTHSQRHPPYHLHIPHSWQQPPQMQTLPGPPHMSTPLSSPSSMPKTHNTIRVRHISSSTFRVLLQYLYTGKIGLTSEQQRKIEKWWPSQSSPRSNDSEHVEQEDNEEVLEQGRVHLPALQLAPGHPSLRPQHSSTTSRRSLSDASEKTLAPIFLPPLEPMAQRSGRDDGPSHFAQVLTRMTAHDIAASNDNILTLDWLPCLRHVATDDHRADSLDLGSIHSSSSCTWETLVHVSHALGLHDLHERAVKALGYHCQMLVVRTLMQGVVAEVARASFDETQLDLQLAMNKDLLEAFLELYEKKGVVEEGEGVRVGRGLVVPVEREGSWDRREIEREEDEHGAQETVAATTTDLLDSDECQDQILELCRDIRSLFLTLQDIMAT